MLTVSRRSRDEALSDAGDALMPRNIRRVCLICSDCDGREVTEYVWVR